MASWLEWEVIYFLNSRIWTFREVGRIMPLALLMKSQILLLLHKKIQWNLEEEFLSLSLSTYLAFSFLRFSQTCEFWSSKANWRLHFLLPSIILTALLGNKTLLKRVQKVMVCDLWISIHFVCFCVSRFVACDCNYDWRQWKTQLRRWLLNFRVRMFVKRAVSRLKR